MRRANAQNHLTRLAVHWTLLVALVLGSLFAPGTMAARASDGSLVIELCTPDGVMHIAVDQDGQPVDEDNHQQPCIWAQAHSVPGWAPEAAPASDYLRTETAAVFLSQATQFLAQGTVKTTQSQAPPQLP